jgi:hypothetical protein
MSDTFNAGERLRAAKLNRLARTADTFLVEAPTDGPGYMRQNREWVRESECFLVAIGDEVTIITTGTAVLTFHMPFAFTLNEVVAGVNTASSSGIVRFDVNVNGVSIFTTRVSIDANEGTSLTAATPAVIASPNIARGARVTIDIDDAGTNAVGAKLYFNGRRAV